MTDRRHYTAWMVNDPSMLDQPFMTITISEDRLNGADPDSDDAWSADSSKPEPLHTTTSVLAVDSGEDDGSGDAGKAIEEAERLMGEAGWRVVGPWRDTPSAYVATVERERTAYTVRSNPMPGPLLAAMSSLEGATVGPQDAYADNEGHHLIARKGSVVVHAVLALDHYADGTAWADGDMSWTVTRDSAPVDCARWSGVVALVKDEEVTG